MTNEAQQQRKSERTVVELLKVLVAARIQWQIHVRAPRVRPLRQSVDRLHPLGQYVAQLVRALKAELIPARYDVRSVRDLENRFEPNALMADLVRADLGAAANLIGRMRTFSTTNTIHTPSQHSYTE